MKVLVLNCGSSSLKYQLIDSETENVLAKGLCERIGIEGSVLKHEKIGQDKFVLDRPVVKARFLNIAGDSPVLKQIRKRMSSSDANELVEADSLAFSSAVKFTTWSDSWIDIAVIAREYSVDYTDLLSKMNKGWIENVDTTGYMKLTYISAMTQKGKIAPLEYCQEDIRNVIISSRRQDILLNLEQDLLKDARENGQFVIY